MRITDTKGVAPANYKTGMLFMNRYRLIDILIMIGALLWGFIWIILLLFVFKPTMYSFIFLVIVMPVTAIALVQPMANYHNNLEYLLLLFHFHRRCKYYSNIIKRVPVKKRGRKKIAK